MFLGSSGPLTEKTVLSAPDGAATDRFGQSVALVGSDFAGAGSRHFALIGSPFDDDAGTDSGSVYEFTRDGDSAAWSPFRKRPGPDLEASDRFGSAVVMEERGFRVVGSPHDTHSSVTEAGSAYSFVPDLAFFLASTPQSRGGLEAARTGRSQRPGLMLARWFGGLSPESLPDCADPPYLR